METATTTDLPDYRLKLPELDELRLNKIRQRAHAFCEGAESVIGIPVKPITPATFSLLVATRSRFLTGGLVGEGDVRNFLWFHSYDYVPTNVRGWEKRRERALRRFTLQLNRPWRRWLRLPPSAEHKAALLALAITDIRAMVTAALADAGRGSGKPVASLQASLINNFAAAYGWSPETISNMPLRQLFQLDRAMAASRGAELRDDDEDALLAAHLRRRQAKLNATNHE